MNEARLEHLSNRIGHISENEASRVGRLNERINGGVLISGPELQPVIIPEGLNVEPKSLPKEPVTKQEIMEARVLDWFSRRPVRNFFRKIGDRLE